jgi:hypothetical protein
MQRAVREARRELASQTIAWFVGTYLPQEFEAPPGSAVEIAR